MSKNIVLCFDGTWNKPGEEGNEAHNTNVVRFWSSVANVAPDGSSQVKWYDQGVGTHWYDKALGGLVGAGLEKNVLDGYKELSRVYDDGDRVFVLGFSRGAYTARSLVGMIRNCGLIRKEQVSDVSLAAAYWVYRTRDDGVDSLAAKLFRKRYSRPIAITFVGVWDTVGALGIPLSVLEDANHEFYEFHDVKLSSIVENAYQALAIDEHRKDYDACVWDPTDTPAGQVLEQRWFAGAHCNVGGGYDDRTLSDITLAWMQGKASALGLGLDPAQVVTTTAANWSGSMVDSYASFLNGEYCRLYPRFFRVMGRTQLGNERIDESVALRCTDTTRDPRYAPTNDGFSRLLG